MHSISVCTCVTYSRVIVFGRESKVNDHAQGPASLLQPSHKLSWCEPALEGGGRGGENGSDPL